MPVPAMSSRQTDQVVTPFVIILIQLILIPGFITFI